jgi:outer membrane protein OmpA-like peptidoglycan-associated protein
MSIKWGLLGAAAAIAIVAVGPAQAGAGRDGWYFGLEAGASMVDDTSLAGPGYASVRFSDDFATFATLGHSWDHWRLEFEIGLRDNDLGSINGANVIDGGLREWSGFVNAAYGIHLSSRWVLDMGAGVGLDNAKFDDHLGGRDDDTVVGIQALAGLTYRVTQHWDLAVTYRRLWTGAPEFRIGTTVSDMDLDKHSVTVGLRYGYDEPPPPPAEPPPPPPPPPPPAPKQFIVFFGFGKANLTAEAQAVVAEAAAAAKAQGSAKILIVGHTDTVGSSDSNHQLSLRRADAVKDELTRLGVSPDAITASGKGESELMVQTGDGVKEPQNRRATIDLN